jgi:hypothetical protein
MEEFAHEVVAGKQDFEMADDLYLFKIGTGKASPYLQSG